LTKRNFTLMQPVIRPLFDTRQFQDTLLRWTDNTNSYNDYIQETWSGSLGEITWADALHDGAFEANEPGTTSAQVTGGNTDNAGVAANTDQSGSIAAAPVGTAASAATNNNIQDQPSVQDGGFELELYTS